MANSNTLRKAGLKVTTPRLRILEFRENSTQRHVTADSAKA